MIFRWDRKEDNLSEVSGFQVDLITRAVSSEDASVVEVGQNKCNLSKR